MAKSVNWRVRGYVRDTGEAVDTVVRALSRDGAGAWCESQGIIADDIQPTQRRPGLDATARPKAEARHPASRGLFEVQVIDREDGSERWVEVEAISVDDACGQVASTGEITGRSRLIRLIGDDRSAMHGQRPDYSEPLTGVSVPILISAIANILVGLLWASTCFGIVIAAPLWILCIFEFRLYARMTTDDRHAVLRDAKQLGIFEIVAGLANTITLICGIVVLINAAPPSDTCRADCNRMRPKHSETRDSPAHAHAPLDPRH